ncbi:MAG: DUF393 domain-containing protein [Bacteroidales bacterium]|nr:DUF393 domain-containing protein [Bacteroidales bacterium]HOI31524.1 DUF393 domain-containing protein [Bacteroidales bacterium]
MAKPILFFDGECSLCNRAVRFVLKHEKNQDLHFAALDSDFAEKELAGLDLPESLVLKIGNRIYIKSAAVFKVLDYLKGWPRFFRIFRFLPDSLLNWKYDVVASFRKRIFGMTTHCGLNSKVDKSRFLDLKQ